MPYLVIRQWNGKTHYALEYDARKSTALDIRERRAKRIEVSVSVANRADLDGVVAMYQAGKLQQ